MKALIGSSLAAALLFAATAQAGAITSKQQEKIQEAAKVLQEIHAVPDKDIPQDLWEKADCAIFIPGLKKAAFIVGGEAGKGLMSCRHNGAWSAPVFMEMTKGSFGFQVGAQSVDLVLLVMNKSGVDKLFNNKVTLGADASVAAGPVGRDARAGTDAQMKAEILSYSRAQGLFAGIDISGGVLKPDHSDNEDVYGKGISERDVVLGTATKPPMQARAFLDALNREAVGTAGKK
jgi:SH3 domain-containing YSC84-like protein 1